MNIATLRQQSRSMSSWKENDGEEEDEEDEENENDYKSAEDRIIFLIDARSNMFEKNSLGEVLFENCVQVALAVMKSKIVASDNSSISVIFFGTVSIFNSLFRIGSR